MKKIVSLLLLAVLLAALLPTAMADSIFNYSLYRVMSKNPNGYCYLYSEPSSITGTNLGRHENGEYVGMISQTNGYCYVYCSNGKYGYIHDDALMRVTWVRNPWYIVSSTEPMGYCYLYSEASSVNGMNLGRYDNGELIEIIDWDADENYAYVCCDRTGHYGFMRKTCLQFWD